MKRRLVCAPAATPEPVPRELHPRVRPDSDDGLFDAEHYPREVRRVSSCFWTPLEVAARAATLFAKHGVTRVLDVGAGPGKFCLGAAAAAPGVLFTGIEQRPHLVAVATAAAARVGASNVRFLTGDAGSVDWADFDGFYFFNPFGENLFNDEDDRFDATVELSGDRYQSEIAWAEQRLGQLAIGSVIATYHGFGGRIPASFELASAERAGTNWLRVWVKRGVGDPGAPGWRELYDGGVRRTQFFDTNLAEPA